MAGLNCRRMGVMYTRARPQAVARIQEPGLVRTAFDPQWIGYTSALAALPR